MVFKNKKLLEDIFMADEKGEKYIIFEHSEKTWVMPVDKLEPALEMYQPTTGKGRSLKKSLIKLKNVKWLLRFVGGHIMHFSINPQILQYIDQTVKKNEKYYVAGYMGDISSEDNDKVTLQVYDDEKIIIYVKASKSDKVAKLFDKEVNALAFLKDKGIENIPNVLSKVEIEGMHIFSQGTKKEMFEKVNLVIDKRHLEFLENITEATQAYLNYEETDFYRNVCLIKNQTKKDDRDDVLLEAIGIIENRLNGKKEKYAFSHGDFTPWNVYYTNRQLNVFDFEYCSYSMPCYIDIFHYITQMSLLGQNKNAEETICLYEKQRELLEEYIESPDFTYLCYLINVISFYKERTVRTNKIVEKQYDEWITILKYLIDRIKQNTEA